MKEGIKFGDFINDWKHYYFEGHNVIYLTAKEAYQHLIDKISDKGTWKQNPYVFIYEFKLIR